MNQSQAKEWLPLIQAVAEGKTLQGNYGTDDKPNWKDVARLNFDCEVEAYRIKPEPKKAWYRVALLLLDKGCYTWTDDNNGGEDDLEKDKRFVRWLTDRIEYELPEGEA